MPPTLDLSGATHAKMMVSPPRINLRRATSYNKYDNGPLSSTSSRFNFNHLVFSPPPSPGLPSLSPPLKKPKKGLKGLVRPSRVVRLVFWAVASFLLFYIVTSLIDRVPAATAPSTATDPDGGFEMIGQDHLPDFPTPIVVTDSKGKSRWTVSIPSGYDFPLSIAEYSDLCTECHEVSGPNSFLDVKEAEKAGLLPSPAARAGADSKRGQHGYLVGESEVGAQKPFCEKSMTFVLESQDAGIGRALMMLWTAYGIAQSEGRAFFIDDSRWAYGEYTEIFQPPPVPECRPPPRHEMLPCPRQARHLVASAATAEDVFGPLQSDLTHPGAVDASSQRVAFDLARQGYEALFKLNKDDSAYADGRARELSAKRLVPKTKGKQNGFAIGMHIRRGDRRPLEFQYQNSYVPLDLYAEAARQLLADRYDRSGPSGGEDAAAKAHSFTIVASDDPMVYESDEIAGGGRTHLAQERIKLASKRVLEEAKMERNVMRKFVDDTFGWEGGFFSAMFWNLGVSETVPTHAPKASSSSSRAAPRPSSETIRLRSLVGRAYMMDLAVLADSSDAVVCTVSAMGCRLLAVMMGWEHGIEKGNWVNIDGGYPWMGLA